MNALEKAVKKQKAKQAKITKDLLKNKKTFEQINNQYTRLFFTKNFPLIMNGDASINPHIDNDSLIFSYRGKSLEIRPIGNPEVWALYGPTKENGFRNFEFHITSKISMEEQLLNMLKAF